MVRCLLWCGETKLTDKVEGYSSFAEEFSRRGPRDRQGRCVRDFDLTTRLFRYPCSYLIYSETFDRMPTEVKEYVLRQLFDVLTGKDLARNSLTSPARIAGPSWKSYSIPSQICRPRRAIRSRSTRAFWISRHV